MADLSVGSWDTPYLDVAPYDLVGTVVTLTVHAPTDTDPAGTDAPVSAGVEMVIDGDQVLRFSTASPVQYTAAGWWVRHWAVDGVGAGDVDERVFVAQSALAGGPTWTPTRSQVAAYIPHRTLARDVGTTVASDDVYQWTFDQRTTPTGGQADSLIADGVSWVLGRVPTLTPALYGMAGVVAALYASAAIERAWPDGDQSLQRADDMEKRMDAMLATLAEANEAATGTGIDIVNPVWSFPCADLRWDYSTYW